MRPPFQPAAEALQQSPGHLPALPLNACVTDFERPADERELRMRALEQEVNALCQRYGAAVRYLPASGLGPGNDATRSSQAIATHNLQMRHAETHASDASHRMLSASLDEGFCIIEKLESKVGEPVDFCCVEANLAFVAQCGAGDARGVVGKAIWQLLPGISEYWTLG